MLWEIVSGTGNSGFSKLNTTTGRLTAISTNSSDSYQDMNLVRTAISSDNSRVYFNNNGVFGIDTATGTISNPTIQSDRGFDLTFSSNQTAMEGASYLYDTNLNAESCLALNDREALNISYVYGTKPSHDGSLLFQPSTNGIDVYDGRLGTLRSRPALPFILSPNFDALVGDSHDNVPIAITVANGNGIAIVDLSLLSEPAPLPYGNNSVSRRQITPSREHHASGGWNESESNEATVRPGAPYTMIRHVTNGSLLRTR